jgi:hypothetical protein
MMSSATLGLLHRAASSTADFVVRWWREATGPVQASHQASLAGAVVRRIMMWAPVVMIFVLAAGALGLHLFTGWRAHDLSAKAVANAEAGEARLARVQIYSATGLRPRSETVRRAAALVESRLGQPAAVDLWEKLGDEIELTPSEAEARAEVMAVHGNDTQFARSLRVLEVGGQASRAAELRALRSLLRGDLDGAIAKARAAAFGPEADPRLRWQLLQLLQARHGLYLSNNPSPAARELAAVEEMTALIDGLAGTPLGDEALALGLEAPYFPASVKSAWAASAWAYADASNPALLPAAGFLAETREEPLSVWRDRLRVLHLGAPAAQRAAFARWMLARGLYDDVLVTAPASEAAAGEEFFAARTDALVALGRWDELYRLAAGPVSAPKSVRLLAQARAARGIGRRAEEALLIRTALRDAPGEGTTSAALALADAQGHRALADEAIVEWCGRPATADAAFRIARDRFGRRGQPASLAAAYEAARQASPAARSVRDYGLYLEMLGGGRVDPSVTSAALADDPTGVDARFNHALALLNAGRGREALAVFDGFDVFFERLPPGLQAVSAALHAATGDSDAMLMARAIDPGLLAPAEYHLIAPLRLEGQ